MQPKRTDPQSKADRILLIEDNPGDARLIEEMLSDAGGRQFHLVRVDRLSAGLERLATGDIAAVLLDPGLPDSQGFETFDRVRRQAPQVPIILLTVLDDEELAVRAVQQGGQDYLVKGQVDGRLLARTLRYSIERKQAEEAQRHNRDLLLALSRAAQSVQRARTSDQVYRAVGEEIKTLGYDLTILTLGDDGQHLHITDTTIAAGMLRAAENLTKVQTQSYLLPILPGSIFERVTAGERTEFIHWTGDETAKVLPKVLRPLAGQLVSLIKVERGIVAPLRANGVTMGALTVTGSTLDEGDVPAVEAFAAQVAISLRNAQLSQQTQEELATRKRAEEELNRSREQLRALAHYLQTAREEERTAIAREIHDELGQSLTALKMDLAWLTKRLPPEAHALHEKARGMMIIITESLQLMRRIASDLRPGLLDDLGLIAAMEWQASEFTKRSGVTCELSLLQDSSLDRDRTTAIFRIFQETLTNIARHAQAKRVEVWLEADEGEIRLTVKDDGVGITADQINDPKSLGLIGIRERTYYFRGSASFESHDGTIVKVRLPR